MNTDAGSAVTFFPFIWFPFLSLSLLLTQHILSCSSTHLWAGRLECCGDQWSTLNWACVVQNTQSRSFFQLLCPISTSENMIEYLANTSRYSILPKTGVRKIERQCVCFRVAAADGGCGRLHDLGGRLSGEQLPAPITNFRAGYEQCWVNTLSRYISE